MSPRQLRLILESGDGCIPGLINALHPRLRKGETMLKCVQRMLIHDALEKTGFHQGKAARMIGMSQPALSQRIYNYWIKGKIVADRNP